MSNGNNVLLRQLRKRGTVLTAAGGCLACVLALAVPADAASAGPEPTLDCVAVSADGSSATAYFGYVNTGDVLTVVPGSLNFFVPAPSDQGQPSLFNTGIFPDVFSTSFDPRVTPQITWYLYGNPVTASAASAPCEAGTPSGTTSPASDVTDTTATLNGVVDPHGMDTSYTFEWGTSTSYGNTSTVTDDGSGFGGGLVQTALTNLSPSTTYFFRLDTVATGSTVISYGKPEQFTTAGTAAPAPTVTVTETETPAPAPTVTVTATPAPGPTVTVTATPAPAPTVTVTVTPPVMKLLTTTLPGGKVGVPYSATLLATGGTTPYTWLVTGGILPRGLRLDPKTGVLSGRPLVACSFRVTITVTDSSGPAREGLSEQYTITITK
jgi:hypothetical protein